MASPLNTEFNYRYQVIGSTPWEKLKTLKGFLEGRKRAAALEEVSRLKYEAKLAELEYLKSTNAPTHEILNLQAELVEIGSVKEDQAHAFELNRTEIQTLERLITELYEECEPTRIPGYTDDQMFEANAANEFAVTILREIQAEVIATGRPSPAKLLNAMSNPLSLAGLKQLGIIPNETYLLGTTNAPLQITSPELAGPLRIAGSSNHEGRRYPDWSSAGLQ
jgi:hypothetical protein